MISYKLPCFSSAHYTIYVLVYMLLRVRICIVFQLKTLSFLLTVFRRSAVYLEHEECTVQYCTVNCAVQCGILYC